VKGELHPLVPPACSQWPGARLSTFPSVAGMRVALTSRAALVAAGATTPAIGRLVQLRQIRCQQLMLLSIAIALVQRSYTDYLIMHSLLVRAIPEQHLHAFVLRPASISTELDQKPALGCSHFFSLEPVLGCLIQPWNARVVRP
jgi:hypothetical protein